VAYLVLQLLDPVDMRVLILENIFQYLPRGEVINFSGELDGLIVGLDGTQCVIIFRTFLSDFTGKAERTANPVQQPPFSW
jgi:hypothetical protein